MQASDPEFEAKPFIWSQEALIQTMPDIPNGNISYILLSIM